MKTITLLLSIFISLNMAAYETVKKEERRLESFSSINVGSAFKVILSQGTKQSVFVEAEETYIDKIQTTVRDGKLYIELKNLEKRRNHNFKTLNVYITIPAIRSIEATAAANVSIQTPFESKETVSFKLSGASNLHDFTLNCKKLELELSGASKLNVDLTADELDVNASGASKLTISGKVDVVDIDGSGASHIDLRNLTYKEGDIDTVGATKLRK